MFFHYLSGTVAELGQNYAVIDCGGVGFECATTAYTVSQLKPGRQQKLYTYCSVREDAFEIFGFSTKEEKRCFELLISVSGVGPKAALAILSVTTPPAFQLAVAAGDEKTLTRAPGVGKNRRTGDGAAEPDEVIFVCHVHESAVLFVRCIPSYSRRTLEYDRLFVYNIGTDNQRRKTNGNKRNTRKVRPHPAEG